MHIYSFKPLNRRVGFKKWSLRLIESLAKCFLILLLAAIPAGAMTWLWYQILFRREISVTAEVQEIVVAALIPLLGILYTVFTAVLIGRVFDDYRNMRTAVKRRDQASFMVLADEDLSQLLHCMAAVSGLLLLGAFMVLHYPDAIQGGLIVGAIAFVLSLLCLIVIEIDDPCYGFWVIKSIPPEWLDCHPKTWREQHFVVTEGVKVDITTQAA